MSTAPASCTGTVIHLGHPKPSLDSTARDTRATAAWRQNEIRNRPKSDPVPWLALCDQRMLGFNYGVVSRPGAEIARVDPARRRE